MTGMIPKADFFLFVIPAALVLDVILGDPLWLPHPVRWMGGAIKFAEPVFRKLALDLRVSGFFFAGALIAGTFGIGHGVLWLAGLVHPILPAWAEIVLLYYCISMRSLARAALAVFYPLRQGRIAEARAFLSMIVGREVARLEPPQIAAAAVETVAENLVDGIAAPLFFAAIGGAPLALAYKMINTLDSMVGYKTPRYLDFGKAAARIDDAANFLPARLILPVIALAAALLAGRGQKALSTAWKEGRQHTSPNAGFPEAAFAGALGICLGGPNFYHGVLVQKPFIGMGLGAARPDHIPKACDVMMLATMLWAFFAWSIALVRITG